MHVKQYLSREQPREEQQRRDRQPRPTSPTVSGRKSNIEDAEPTTSRDMPDKTLRDKEPSNPDDTQ